MANNSTNSALKKKELPLLSRLLSYIQLSSCCNFLTYFWRYFQRVLGCIVPIMMVFHFLLHCKSVKDAVLLTALIDMLIIHGSNCDKNNQFLLLLCSALILKRSCEFLTRIFKPQITVFNCHFRVSANSGWVIPEDCTVSLNFQSINDFASVAKCIYTFIFWFVHAFIAALFLHEQNDQQTTKDAPNNLLSLSLKHLCSLHSPPHKKKIQSTQIHEEYLISSLFTFQINN